MGLQMGPYKDQGMSLAMLRDNPSGVDLGPLKPQLPGRLNTPDKRINCNTPEPLADLARLRDEFSQPHHGLLSLIGRRHVRSNNSWMHNYHRLMKGKGRCTLLMHPKDMAQRDIEDGAQVTVSSRVGSVTVAVEASETVMPGVVSLPHGFGHDRPGTRLGIAHEHAGVSCNDITDELAIDALSGNAAVNGVLVSVAPA